MAPRKRFEQRGPSPTGAPPTSRPAPLLALLLAALSFWPIPPAEAHSLLTTARIEPTAPSTGGGPASWADIAGDALIVRDRTDGLLARGLRTGRTLWRYDAEVPIESVVRRGDEVVVAAGDLVVLDRALGRVQWRAALACERGAACRLTVPWQDGRRAVLLGYDTRPDSVRLVDIEARRMAWSDWALVGPVGYIEATDDLVLVGDARSRFVTAVDAATGEVLWRTRLPSEDWGAQLGIARLWANGDSVHVHRAAPGAIGRVETLDAQSGRWVSGTTSVSCAREPRSCGLFTAPGCAVAWSAPLAGERGPGRIVVHDLATGETPLDVESYLAAPPVLTREGRLLVARRQGSRVVLEVFSVPDAALLWTRGLPGREPLPRGAQLVLAADADTFFIASPVTGLVTGLDAATGQVESFGVVDLPSEPVVGALPFADGLALLTRTSVVALREEPVDSLPATLLAALKGHERTRARQIDDAAARLADDIADADDAHALMLRHGLLRAARSAALGGGAAELAALRTPLAATPTGRLAPVMVFARELNNLLADWLLDAPPDGPTADALETLAEIWTTLLAPLEEPLLEGTSDDRAILRATGAQLATALARADRVDTAVRVLHALDDLPIALFDTDVPGDVRAAVARRAASAARSAAWLARAGRVAGAIEQLSGAASMPFADAILGLEDGPRRRIVDLRYGTTPSADEVEAVARAAERSWASRGKASRESAAECLLSCVRRRLTCVRPCVTEAACDDSRLACETGCRASGAPTWSPPTSKVPLEAPDFAVRCL